MNVETTNQQTPNPFSTRFVHPQSTDFVALNLPQSLNDLAEEFRRLNCRAQIVGPHGCGKSTLACAIAKLLGDSFAQIRYVTIRRRDRFNFNIQTNGSSVGRSLFIIDGWEHLPWLHKTGFQQFCHDSNHGFLITTHKSALGISVLANIHPTLEHFQRIVERLCRNVNFEIRKERIESAFHQCNGDYRETLMTLYDLANIELAVSNECEATDVHSRSQ